MCIQVDKLNALNCELSAGTTVVVALIYCGRLYVANVGDSRALLCRTDSNGVLRVVQLSVDHDLSNEDELLRLSQLGLDVDKFRQGNTVLFCYSYFFLNLRIRLIFDMRAPFFVGFKKIYFFNLSLIL
jgi:hypothetical protein